MNKISDRYRGDHVMLSRQGKKPQRPGFLSLVKQSLRKDIIHGPLFLLQEKKIEQ